MNTGEAEVDLGRVHVALIDAAAVIDLRHAVLRPGRPRPTAIFAEDTWPGVLHLAARAAPREAGQDAAGPIVGVLSLVPNPSPLEPDVEHAWQLRGMAVATAWQGHGLGSLILARAVDEVVLRGGLLLWCNARLAAVGLYQRAGFTIRGDRFEVVGIGPHHHLRRALGLGVR